MSNANHPYEVKNDTGAVIDIIFSIIAILAAVFSGYTTFKGFSHDFPYLLSAIIAILVSLGLLAISFRFRQLRKEGKSALKLMAFYFLIFCFSFISNTNAIYFYFLENDIVKDTQIEAFDTFNKGTAIITNKIDQIGYYSKQVEKDNRLKKEVKNFCEQIKDTNNPGLGDQAKVILDTIQVIVGNLTRLEQPREKSPEKLDKFCLRYQDLIYSSYNATKSPEFLKSDKIKSFVLLRRKAYSEAIQKQNFSSQITDAIQQDYQHIISEVAPILGEINYLPTINSTADKIGSFEYTWKNFLDGINQTAIFLAVILSLLLDLVTPVMVFAIYSYHDEDEDEIR